MTDDLVRRVRRWEPDDPVRTMASVLDMAAQLVPAGLRLPAIERLVHDPIAYGDASPKIQRRRREQAHSPSWRVTAAADLRALAIEVGAGSAPESIEPGRAKACLFTHRVLRQHHVLGLVEAAERDPGSLHSVLPQKDRVRVQDLMLGTYWQWPVLETTVACWNGRGAALTVGDPDSLILFLFGGHETAFSESVADA